MNHLTEERKKELIESGTILYLREHTDELKNKNKIDLAKTILLYAVFVCVLLLIGYIKYNNVVNNIVANCG